ncbi:hypothetical protein Rsub_07994 [Raphidocelis subcapitata]|uniref:GDP-D-glucose phosphorylase 1 n=1 Tax=Raphidocelis subcapitata TaxID=307507 RepID=A0A2V0P7B9_9CHLO|nr:hypothetical protein Rsub_07994 [Raphidocelis subcapitata]|eukprot:GBF94822.1 hypothetical protein Rsub_07994 [Raphidocelis subcapitata]
MVLTIDAVGSVLAAAPPAAAAPAAAGAPAPAPADASIAALAGTRLPTYQFARDPAAPPPRLGGPSGDAAAEQDEGSTSFGWDAVKAGGELLRGPQPAAAPGRALLDGLLIALWDDAAEKGLFRYDVTACPTKVLPGDLGFVAQLNEGRATKKRPTEFRVDQVIQAFDPSKFNFTKASFSEVLFAFEPSPSPSAPSSFAAGAAAAPSPNAVLINVSPIDYGHALLCPRVLDRLPQLLDRESVLLALRYASEAGNPYLRVGYNSLGAYATINHLHFQSYYLNTPMPIERAPTAPLPGIARRADGVRVSRLAPRGYPVNAFVLEGGGAEALADAAAAAALALQDGNVPHNMLISECGRRVFIAPQRYAARQAAGDVPEKLLATGVNPAVWEITGHMVLFRPDDYESFTQDLAWELLAAISIEEARFLEIARTCFGACHAAPADAAAAGAGAARRCSECGAEAAAAEAEAAPARAGSEQLAVAGV